MFLMNVCSELDSIKGKLKDIKEMVNEVFAFKEGMLPNPRENAGEGKTNTNLGNKGIEQIRVECLPSCTGT